MLVALNTSWSTRLTQSLYLDSAGLLLLLSGPSDESRALSDRDPRRWRMSTQRHLSSIGSLKRPYTVQGLFFNRCAREVTSDSLVRSSRCSLWGDGAMLHELLAAHNPVVRASILQRGGEGIRWLISTSVLHGCEANRCVKKTFTHGFGIFTHA